MGQSTIACSVPIEIPLDTGEMSNRGEEEHSTVVTQKEQGEKQTRNVGGTTGKWKRFHRDKEGDPHYVEEVRKKRQRDMDIDGVDSTTGMDKRPKLGEVEMVVPISIEAVVGGDQLRPKL